MSITNEGKKLLPGLALILLLAAGLAYFLFGWGTLSMLEFIVRYFWVAILAVIFVVILFILSESGKVHPYVATIIGIALAVPTLIFMLTFNYRASSVYVEKMISVNEELNYESRAPWVTADQASNRLQGDIRGESVAVKSVPETSLKSSDPDVKTTRYTTLIEAPGVFNGYSAIQTLSMPTTGPVPSSVMSTCEFPENMDKRFGHLWPGNNLDRVVYAEKKFAHYNKSDSYAYCQDDGTPIIVIPLFRYEGFITPVKVPDGAAVYRNGHVDILSPSDLVEENIQGPTYPMSVADRQRESINASLGLWKYYFGEYGYTETKKDEEDANSDNYVNFVLQNSDGKLTYVTPLAPKGSSTSMTHVAEVPAQQTGEGGQAEFRLNESVDLPSTSTIAQNISEMSINGDPEWAARWAKNMQVYEILPGKNGHWVASIGQGQAVSYRADISPDGTVKVEKMISGDETTGKDVSGEPQPTGETATVESGKPLSEMSDEELIKLIGDAAEELEQRKG